MISAKIIADSKNRFGNRITTFVCTFPRIILAEVNTHRMFSRNSASSRAIPFEKMVKMVEENPFIPIKWMKDHRGMQGSEYFAKEDSVRLQGWSEDCTAEHALRVNWLKARDFAIEQANYLNDVGLTKQIVNRLLEPFMWHTAIITATEFENFFALRYNDAAEIHLQELARLMMLAYNDSEPKLLNEGEWHIPFGDNFDENKIEKLQIPKYEENGFFEETIVRDILKIKISTARCARVSYMNFEGKDDYEADLKLYDNLAKMYHFSPFEHCAKAMDDREYEYSYNSVNDDNDHFCGNFKGFIQLRKTFENENRKDNRVIKK